jgi:subtilisin-like proprotein convertase family protein
MRTVASENDSQSARGQGRSGSRSAAIRKTRLRSSVLERLEERTLLAVLPPVSVSSQIDISDPAGLLNNGNNGNQTAPQVAIDPTAPQDMVAVWVTDSLANQPNPNNNQTPVFVQGAVSTNAGQTWTSFSDLNGFSDSRIDFNQSQQNGPIFMSQVTDPTVAFDAQHNFYVVDSPHAANFSSGEVALNKFHFAVGGGPTHTGTNIVYRWAQQDAAYRPTLAVDSNVNSAAFPGQQDPFVNNVYVAWSTNQALTPNTSQQNPNRIQMAGSSDGGQTFSTPILVDGSSYSSTARDASPQIAISQGGPGVTPGQVTVIWDDTGTLSQATPVPLDVIASSRIQNGGSGALFQSTGEEIPVAPFIIPLPGPIQDAVAPPQGSTLNTPVTSTYDIPVTFGANFTPDDLSLTLGLQHNNLSELQIVLVGANGQRVTLVQNRLDNNNNDQSPNPPVAGISGTTLGQAVDGAFLGTTFNDSAPRSIFNNAGGAASVGTFRSELGTLDSLLSGTVNGTWKLEITDFRNSGTNPNPAPNVVLLSLRFTSAMNVSAANTTISTTTVRGAVDDGTYATGQGTGSPSPDVGIGPGAVITSDNTLGAFSPHEGRLYVAVTERSAGTNIVNDPLNTDIGLFVSDNGGASWQSQGRVNDDNATTDGFSQSGATFAGGKDFISGRAQFQPAVAVDPTTGTLVVSFRDARDDASGDRVATYIASSIDGGASFGPETYVNPQQTARDAITGQIDVLGPVPDNETTVNPLHDTQFDYGDRMSLAVFGGHVFPVWAGNQNGGPKAASKLNIFTANAVIGAGPRIISSTMGPVQGGATLADGTPILNSFQVTFDRPVDPNTFTKSAVSIQFESTTGAITPITPSNVQPVSVGQFGAQTFLITFPNQSGVGTYSYAIAPTISDRIFTRNSPTAGALMDQNANGVGGQFPGDFYAVPRPINGAPFSAPFDPNTLPIIIPGPQMTGSSIPGASGSLATDAVVNALDVSFDRDMEVSTFTPTQVLRMMGPAGQVYGPFAVTPSFNASSGLGTQIAGGQTLDFPMTVSENGTFTINDLRARLDLSSVSDSNLTVTLIAPGGVRRAILFSNVGVGGQNFTNTVFDDAATTPIMLGISPFTGSFVPVQSLDAAFKGLAVQGTWTLEVTNAAGAPAATLNSWSLEATPSNANAVARTFRIGFPTQTLSGTYTVQVGSSVTDDQGHALDMNENAGLQILRQVAIGGATAPVTYNSTDATTTTPLPITTGTAPNNVTTSILNVPDNFPIQGITLRLNISYPHDPDLTVQLVPPSATGLLPITLFTNVGQTGNQSNFTNTVFDESASTPIDFGGPPFSSQPNSSHYIPQQDINQVLGMSSQGQWQLVIQDNGTAPASGQLNNWSLTLLRGVPDTGLGEAVADQASTSFRIFTMSPTSSIASDTWTAVGPASVSGVNSGRVSGLAVDPSDPSGNTVYVGGASGGVWKSTNFLTTSGGGPTYIPLTNFGPTFGINIGGIAAFGRNNDPNQSIIFAATGEGDTGSTGVGFLRSMDGGSTWTLLDSSVNVDSSGNTLPFNSQQRDHAFVGTSSFKIVVDPTLTPNGGVVVYAALSGANGGIWRSADSGNHWQKMLTGQATDVVLAPFSGTGAPGGNLQIVYAAIRGVGVFLSSNEGATWNPMAGNAGNGLIVNTTTRTNVNPADNGNELTPNGPNGRIVLATPALTGDAGEDALFEGWLYAAVATPDSHLQGIYLTKDFGHNWTFVHIPNVASVTAGGAAVVQAIPTNNISNPNYDIGGGPPGTGLPSQLNYDFSMAIDPVNPNVIYVGGTQDGQPTGFIRVDTTGLFDAHAFVPFSGGTNDGGSLQFNSTGRLSVDTTKGVGSSFLNLIKNPGDPFGDPTISVSNGTSFSDTGAGATWIPFDLPASFTDQHRIITMVDPLTGQSRIIIGDDQGVFTGVDNNGTFDFGIGSADAATGSRNGNLQITQFYYGALQPSNIAAQVAGALFYGSAQDDGTPQSASGILTPGSGSYGDITWSGPTGDASGVATDPTGSGTLYQYKWPCCGGNHTDFFTVNGVGQTFGLIQASNGLPVPDPQWPSTGGPTFAVNPVNGQQIIMASIVSGRLFRTEDRGTLWTVIGDPSALDASAVTAPAFGAPDPNAPNGVGNLDDFLYAGTARGHIFMSQTGGGNGTQWTNISSGLDGSTVQYIIADPVRGSHDAFAVTSGGTATESFSAPIPVNNPVQIGNGLTATSTLPLSNINVMLQDLSLSVNITYPTPVPPPGTTPKNTVADLSLTLIAPNGTQFPIALSGQLGTGQNFTGTFDLATLTTNGLNLLFKQLLLNQNIAGNWQLQVGSAPGSVPGTLNSWSLTMKAPGGVYYIPDSTAPNAEWHDITGNVFTNQIAPFGVATLSNQQPFNLTSLAVDWRYVIPDTSDNLGSAPHPMLYVAGQGGAYRSTNDGLTWTDFPNGVAASPTSQPSIAVPANGSASTSITIPFGSLSSPTATVQSLAIDLSGLDFSAAALANLTVTLQGPGGTTTTIPTSSLSSPIPLSAFTGNLAAGTYALTLTNTGPIGGTLVNWSLNLTDNTNGLGLSQTFSPTLPAGGYLPNANITDLQMASGAIDPTTGRAITAPGDPNVLTAITYGRGDFAIRLSPDVFPNTNAAGQPDNFLFLDHTTVSDTGSFQNDEITKNPAPFVDGLSEQSAFGNVVTVNLYDQTKDPNHLHSIGTGTTDANGNFKIQISLGTFKNDGSDDGYHVIAAQATDQAGTKGNVATFVFRLLTRPPGASGAPVLDPTTDSGTQGDSTTNNNNGQNPAPILDVPGNDLGSDVTLERAPLSFTSPPILNVLPANGTLTSTITFSSLVLASSPNATIASLSLDLSKLNFATPSDLTIMLKGPDGTQIAVPTPFSNNVVLTGLNGKAAAGAYTLSITNHDGTTGTFGGWTLTANVNVTVSTIQSATPIAANSATTSTLTVAPASLANPSATIPGLILDLSRLKFATPADLTIKLTLPDGKTVVTVPAPYGNNIDLPVPSGISEAGTYTLSIVNAAGNTGSLSDWSLQFAGVNVSPTAVGPKDSPYSTVSSTITIPAASLPAGATITNGVTLDLSGLAFVASSALTVTLAHTDTNGVMTSTTITGPFTAGMVVNGLNGALEAGTYTLTIANSSYNTGTLNSWSLIPSASTVFDNLQVPNVLPPNGSLVSTINVPLSALTDASATIAGLVLDLSKLNIATPADLVVSLTGPDGTTITVPAPYTSAVSLSGLNGKALPGAYTLTIRNTGTNTGTFGGWTLTASPGGGSATQSASHPAGYLTAGQNLTSTVTIPAASLTNPNATIPGLVLDLSQLVFPTPTDLTITLTAPDGTTISVPGPYGNNIALTGLNGKLAAGTYTLSIQNAGTNAGTLDGWTLTLAGVQNASASTSVPAGGSIAPTVAVPASSLPASAGITDGVVLDLSNLVFPAATDPTKLAITLTLPDGTTTLTVPVPAKNGALLPFGRYISLSLPINPATGLMNPVPAAGTYTLTITNNGTTVGTLGSWSLALPGTMTTLTAVNSKIGPATGTPPVNVDIADTNAGNGAIPDGVYLYSAVQSDVAGNIGPIGAGSAITIDTNAPVPLAPILSLQDDSGLPVNPRDTDIITATTNPHFTGTAEPNATITLFVNGVAAGTTKADATGAYGIAAGVPLAPGLNNITVEETDITGNQGAMSQALVVRLDTTPPTGTRPTLAPSTDTGVSNADGVTYDPTPTFVGTAEVPQYYVPNQSSLTAGALVQIYAQLVGGQPDTNPIVLVGEALADPVTGKFSVTVGNYINPQPPGAVTSLSDGSYNITAIQYDVAGNPSKALSFGNAGAVVITGLDENLEGDNLGGPNQNLNEGSWLFMQKTLELIRPNITNNNKVLVALGVDATQNAGGVGGFATEAIDSAFLQSNLPGKGWSLVYVTGASNMNTYLSGGAAQTLDANGNVIGTITMAQTGLLNITTDWVLDDDMTDPELNVVNQHGLDIKNFVNGGGGLYAETEFPLQDPNAVPYGWLSSVFPGLTGIDSGGTLQGLQLTTQAPTIFPALQVSDISGDWHSYFAGNFGSLAPIATVPDPIDSSVRDTIVLASTGVGSAATGQLTIDTDGPDPKPTVAPTLEPGSDSGGGNITHNNNAAFPAPIFDATNVEAGAEVALYRAPVVGGVVGTPVLVNAVLNKAATGTVSLADINQSNLALIDLNTPANSTSGPVIPDGTYEYFVQLTDVAGVADPISPGTSVTILATAPTVPTNFQLDPTTDSSHGQDVTNFNNSQTTPTPLGNAPVFDLFGINPNLKLELFRAPVNPTTGAVGAAIEVNTLFSAAGATGGGPPVTIADLNGNLPGTNGALGQTIPDGVYQYTVMLVDLANDASPVSSPVKVTITGSNPSAPIAIVLDPSTDTSALHTGNATDFNNASSNPPIFDVSGVESNGAANLWRAPLSFATSTPAQNITAAGTPNSTVTSTVVIPASALSSANETIPGIVLDLSALAFLTPSNLTVTLSHTDLNNVTTSAAITAPFTSNVIVTGLNGALAAGTYTLTVTNSGTNAGSLGSWSVALAAVNTTPGTTAIGPNGTTSVTTTVPASSLPSPTAKITSGVTLNLSRLSFPTLSDLTLTLKHTDTNGTVTTASVSAPYTANTLVTGLNGAFAAGTYTLSIANAGANSGTLAGWLLTVNGVSGVMTSTVTIPVSSVASPTATIKSGVILDLSSLNFPTPSGLTITLQGPSGASIKVPGPYGRFINLAGLNGTLAAGTYTLSIANAGAGVGTLGNWSLALPGTMTLLSEVGSLASATSSSTIGQPLVTVDVPDTNAGNGAITDGVYLYTADQTDEANNEGSLISPGILVTVNALAPAGVPVILDPRSDTGKSNSDGITQITLAPNFPIFDISNVVPGATVELFRQPINPTTGLPVGSPILVNAVISASGGLITLADINQSNLALINLTNPSASTAGPAFANGTYFYSALQIDPQGNVGPMGPQYRVTYITSAPPTLPVPVLDINSDTGPPSGTANTYSTSVTNPTFDVTGVETSILGVSTPEYANVTLLRDGIAVASSNYAAPVGGVVQITDPGPVPDGSHVYTVFETDVAGNMSPGSPGATVVIRPDAPSSVTLEPGSDTSHGQDITRDNNGTNPAPIFDVAGVEAGAEVKLFRALINPVTGLAGTPVLVDARLNGGTAGTVSLADINQSNLSRINLTNPANSTPGVAIPDGQYRYTAEQIDTSGTVSQLSPATTVTIVTSAPQLVLSLVQQAGAGAPGFNVTNNATPQIKMTGLVSGAVITLTRDGAAIPGSQIVVGANGTATFTEPAALSAGAHTYTAVQTDVAGNVSTTSTLTVTIDTSATPAVTLALDPNSISGPSKSPSFTNVTTPTIDVGGIATADGISDQVLVYRAPVVNGVVGTPVLVLTVPYGAAQTSATYAEPSALANGQYQYSAVQTNVAGTSSTTTTLTVTIDTVIPVVPSLALDPASDSGTKGDNITNVTTPTFDVTGVVAGGTVTLFRFTAANPTPIAVASQTSVAGGTVKITDADPPAGQYSYEVQQTDAAGNVSPLSAPLSVTFNTTAPGKPSLKLDPVTDSGVQGDNITNNTKPEIDITGLVPGATVMLTRDGTPIAASLVIVAANGTATFTEPAAIGAGAHTYSVVQTNTVGNTSAPATLTVTIDTSTPAAPSLSLVSTTSSGATFNVGGILPGATVSLFSGNTLVSSQTVVAGGSTSFTVQGLSNGQYGYSVRQTDVAGNVSPTSAAVAVTIGSSSSTGGGGTGTPGVTGGNGGNGSGSQGHHVVGPHNHKHVPTGPAGHFKHPKHKPVHHHTKVVHHHTKVRHPHH